MLAPPKCAPRSAGRAMFMIFMFIAAAMAAGQTTDEPRAFNNIFFNDDQPLMSVPAAVPGVATTTPPATLDGGHLASSRRLGYYACWGQSHALCGGYYCSCGKGCGTTCYYSCTLCYCSPGSYTPNGYGYVKSGTTCPHCPGGWYQPYYGRTSCPYACPAVRTRLMFLLCFCRNHSTHNLNSFSNSSHRRNRTLLLPYLPCGHLTAASVEHRATTARPDRRPTTPARPATTARTGRGPISGARAASTTR